MLAFRFYLSHLPLFVGSIFLILFLTACATPTHSNLYYRVKPADTLTRIAQLHQQSVHNLMRWNHLTTDHIQVGQRLRVTPPKGEASATAAHQSHPASTHSSKARKRPPSPTLSLIWPASGQVTRDKSPASALGLHISNVSGTPIVAAAAGKVVYASNALPHYGNLVILQHDANFLTIYAHNRRLLVQPHQHIQQGQIIAEMGNRDSAHTELYFELRHNGKPMDPSKMLPMR